jgi:hypothetical protein
MGRPLTDWTAGAALGAGFSAVRRATGAGGALWDVGRAFCGVGGVFCTGAAARGKWLNGVGLAGEAGAERWTFTGSSGGCRAGGCGTGLAWTCGASLACTCGTGFAGLLVGFAVAA